MKAIDIGVALRRLHDLNLYEQAELVRKNIAGDGRIKERRTGEALANVLAEYRAGERGLPTYAELRAMCPEQANAIADPLAISAAAGMQQPAVTNVYKLVPLVPTEEMIYAGHHKIDYDRTDQNTCELEHESQTENGAGTTCKQDVIDAYASMLAAAPDVAQPAPSALQQSLADALHYPGCWDTAAYPTLSDALSAANGYFKCSKCAPAASPVPFPVEPQLVYPPTMTPTLEHVLGFMNFRTGPIAHVFQKAGFAIPTKCEAEQAFVLDRMIRAVLTHGEDWADAFTADLRAQQAIIVEREAAAIPATPAAAEQARPAAAQNNVEQVRSVIQSALTASKATTLGSPES